MKRLFAVFLLCIPQFAVAQELKLPPGFTATLVTDGLDNARHIAIRGNDIYVSTNTTRANTKPQAIHAIRLGPDHKPVQVTAFGNVWGGTGIRVHDGALYAASGTTVWRYALDGGLVPKATPQAIVTGMQDRNNRNRILAFDESGNLYVALSGDGNNACAIGGRLSATPGPRPCPELADRAGIWRFSAIKPAQKFVDGEHYATGIRNNDGLPLVAPAQGPVRNPPRPRRWRGGLAAILHQGAGAGGGRCAIPHLAWHRFRLALQLL